MNAPKPELRKRVGYQAILLGGFSTLATVLLVGGNIATQGAILERQKEDLQRSLNQVVPAVLYDNNLLDNPLLLPGPGGKSLTVYRGTRGMQINVLAYEVSGQGYGGEIRLIMGLDADGRILGVRVLSHAETPGLGDKIEVERSGWVLEFNGLSLGNPPQERWKVKKDGGRFDAFSGATITPRGVLKAIEGGLVFYRDHQTELRSPPVVNSTTVSVKEVPDHE
jgi:Na+-translocating ferredoxin:NAD+ oxidoreductase subunit G